MSPLTSNIENVDSEHGDIEHGGGHPMTDMRRVSMSLAFSPARQRRRRTMNSMNRWFHGRAGVRTRRPARAM